MIVASPLAAIRTPPRVWGDVIRAAVLTAQARRRPLLALLPLLAETGPLWRLAACSPAATVAWQAPGAEAAALGLGTAWSARTDDPAQVARLLQIVEDLMTASAEVAAVCGVEGDLARAYGGLAFDPAGESRGCSGAPVASFHVPAIVVCQRQGFAVKAAIAARVEPGDSGAAIEQRAHAAITLLQDAVRAAQQAPGQRGRWRRAEPEQGRRTFVTGVDRALAAIARGDVEKVVLSRDVAIASDRPLSHAAVWEAFEAMATAAPDTARYAIALGEDELFFGASPERLVAISGSVARSDCLAGTDIEGTAGAKERREHEVVERAILESLAPLSISVSQAPEPIWRAVPGLVHLWSPLSAQLSPEVSVADVLLALHPTPAVGGWPRQPAIALIRELEGRPRGWYAGAIGWIGAREADFAVGIRGIRWSAGQAVTTVGAGIVAGSTPEGEWRETERKADAVLALMGGER